MKLINIFFVNCIQVNTYAIQLDHAFTNTFLSQSLASMCNWLSGQIMRFIITMLHASVGSNSRRFDFFPHLANLFVHLIFFYRPFLLHVFPFCYELSFMTPLVSHWAFYYPHKNNQAVKKWCGLKNPG